MLGTMLFHFNFLVNSRKLCPTFPTLSFSTNVAIASNFNIDYDMIKNVFLSSQYLVCITGAGVSTSSGIPDYRSPNGSYSRGHKPMMHSEFMTQEHSRKRYWARSTVGWTHFHHSKPNDAHYALARLEQANILKFTITQNVDRLHQKAGSKYILDLHGRNDIVSCTSCKKQYSRRIIQEQITLLNPTFDKNLLREEGIIRADGDANIDPTSYDEFTLPCCASCGQFLKPDVVFFGDSIPRDRVESAFQEVGKADALLVVGSSLEVYSAFRLVKHASDRTIPILILNQGQTRAERSGLSNIYKIEENCSIFLKHLADDLLKT